MSLVAYGSSDESESEDQIENVVIASASKVRMKTDVIKSSSAEDDVGEFVHTESKANDDKDFFSKLPTPSCAQDIISLKTSVLSGKKSSQQKGPVRILIPSLPEFDESEEPPAKKRMQHSSKGTKLMSMLPPPKGASVKEGKSTLVPDSVARRPAQSVKPVKPVSVTKVTSVVPQKAKNLISYDDSGDESGGEDTAADFFSLAKDHSVPTPESTNSLNVDTHMLFLGASCSEEHPSVEEDPVTAESSRMFIEPQANSGQDYISFDSDDLQLDDNAMLKLCGRKGRRNQENVEIIDVNGDAIMPDSREWLTKQLTQEQPRSSSRSKKDGPSTQQRRKHQITYLAFQAKENELELQNQWANNRQTRRQTQSKYGF